MMSRQSDADQSMLDRSQLNQSLNQSLNKSVSQQ